jgi:hypothetical protein
MDVSSEEEESVMSGAVEALEQPRRSKQAKK